MNTPHEKMIDRFPYRDWREDEEEDEEESKEEQLKILLEGKNGFFRKYYDECINGSINGLKRIVNETIDEIFDLFKEE